MMLLHGVAPYLDEGLMEIAVDGEIAESGPMSLRTFMETRQTA